MAAFIKQKKKNIKLCKHLLNSFVMLYKVNKRCYQNKFVKLFFLNRYTYQAVDIFLLSIFIKIYL